MCAVGCLDTAVEDSLARATIQIGALLIGRKEETGIEKRLTAVTTKKTNDAITVPKSRANPASSAVLRWPRAI